MHPLPGAVYAPGAEVVVDGLPGREVVRQESPCTPTTHDVEDSVEDLTQGMHPRPPDTRRSRHERLDALPLGIGQVGLVCSSHARYSTELLPHNLFSDSFLLETV